MGKQKSVALLSGGLDSATTFAIALDEGYDVYAFSFDYGQRHKKELEAAEKIAEHYKVKHKIVKIDFSWAKSALTDKKIKIPESRKNIGKNIPVTYVPARNMIMLSFALAYAETINADAVFIGANAIDYSGYPDCRPEFYKAFQKAAALGTKKGVESKPIQIKYPLINMTKSKIIKKGIELGVPYHLTWSCYKGKKKACGKCDSCILRLKGFKEAGYDDPVKYEVRE
ncbi:MAG: 7-cyano-7-deazaguanine synthase QueC [Candidatus Thermoplasmatota archaeon]|nr:7-cyano-7-deazaguanine synthase QueC [Candidatus Thermoplasmatota archaeon]